MTLHTMTEKMKKLTIGVVIASVTIGTIVIIFKVSVYINNTLHPPAIIPPNHTYDKLPAVQFPRNAVDKQLTYSINTASGTLPDFPDRINIYPISHAEPNFLNLDKVRGKVSNLGFTSQEGNLLPETQLGNGLYAWNEPTGLQRKIVFNIVTFDFTLTSNYLSSLTVLGAARLSNQDDAISIAHSFLGDIQLFPPDIDLTKTQIPGKNINYITYPQLFSITNGQLTPATSLDKAQIIRVDFYQKDLTYNLATGVLDRNNLPTTVKMQLPILYPHPPYSTMNVLIASGDNASAVVSANFTHQTIDTSSDTATPATYAIKTAQEAFDELKSGKAYTASYYGSDNSVLINNIYLAYYLGDQTQDYLMPIIVFEGNNGFFAYISAVKTEWLR